MWLSLRPKMLHASAQLSTLLPVCIVFNCFTRVCVCLSAAVHAVFHARIWWTPLAQQAAAGAAGARAAVSRRKHAVHTCSLATTLALPCTLDHLGGYTLNCMAAQCCR